MICVASIDYLVLTVASVSRTFKFYSENFGMKPVGDDSDHYALRFGDHIIYLHPLGKEKQHSARNFHVGSADICFITKKPIDQVKKELEINKVPILSDITVSTGARGLLQSIYIHDPDGNLIQLSHY
ncbi:MAG: VOC family protein [Flavobacteriaceae bacterium]|nr:VOC family protein [Flavobacteriaceae bacterium]